MSFLFHAWLIFTQPEINFFQQLSAHTSISSQCCAREQKWFALPKNLNVFAASCVSTSLYYINSIQWSIYDEFINSGLPDNIWAIGNSLTYIFDKMVPMVWWSGKGVSKWIMKKVQKVLYNGVLCCIMIKYMYLYCWYVYHTTMGRISIIKLTIGD